MQNLINLRASFFRSKVPTLYETKKPSATGNFPGHVPYDEIAMKQSGFVDNHCKHMTIADIDHEDAVKEKRHVEFPSVFSGISDEPETISDRSDDGKDEPNQVWKIYLLICDIENNQSIYRLVKI